MHIMKKLLQTILLVVCLTVFCYSGYKIYQTVHTYTQADQSYQKVTDQYVTPQPTQQSPDVQSEQTQQPEEYAPIQIDFDALRQDSPDVVGWIYCPDTVLNYPVVQGQDNDFYLRHLADQTYNYSGSIFVDSRNAGDFSDFHTIVYGHNMRNGSMFSVLEEFRDPEFRKAHPVMYLLTPEQDYKLEIMAGILTDGNSPLYTRPGTQEAFHAFVEQFWKEADFAAEVDPSNVEKTVCLSTCAYDFEEARYLVLGSLVPIDRPAANGQD